MTTAEAIAMLQRAHIIPPGFNPATHTLVVDDRKPSQIAKRWEQGAARLSDDALRRALAMGDRLDMACYTALCAEASARGWTPAAIKACHTP